MKKYTVLFIAVLFLLSGCGVWPYYKPLSVDSQIKNGASIAVISGLEDDLNILVVSHFTSALAEGSKFKVMSQKDIAKKLKNYPVDISGPYTDKSYFTIEEDFTNSNQEELRKIQKKLGVDYLYVMWTPTVQTINGGRYYFCSVNQLYSASGGEEVGRGRLYYAIRTSSKKMGIDLKKVSDFGVKLLCRKTGMSKETKL